MVVSIAEVVVAQSLGDWAEKRACGSIYHATKTLKCSGEVPGPLSLVYMQSE